MAIASYVVFPPLQASRRYGRFTVPAQWAREFRSEYLRVLGKCAVLRAEHLFIDDVIEVWACSDHFDVLPDNEVVPEYQWIFQEDGHFYCQRVER